MPATGLHRLISPHHFIFSMLRSARPNRKIITAEYSLWKPEKSPTLGGTTASYAQLAEKLAEIGVQENERNLNNKISRGGFTAAFMLQCLEAIKTSEVKLL